MYSGKLAEESDVDSFESSDEEDSALEPTGRKKNIETQKLAKPVTNKG